MLAALTHILPLATIRRKRVLPVDGTVLVRAGQKVAATDVIATANLTPEHIALDVARGLAVSPKDAAEYVKRQVGDAVEADSIIAERGRLGSRVVRAPVAGRVAAISGGQVLLEVKNEPFELRAALPGEMVSLVPDRGGIVETVGAWIQGVWGNGKIDFGELVILAETPNHVLSTKDFDASQRGMVMLVGHCGNAKPLEAAAAIPIRGLILASITPDMIRVALRMPYPIVLIEGFGKMAMNLTAHTLISTNASREVSINAEPFDRFGGERPEVIIPLQAAGETRVPLDIDSYSAGQKVRVLREPNTGAVAEIIQILPAPVPFPSGLQLQAAQIEFPGGEKTVVPLANIEVLG